MRLLLNIIAELTLASTCAYDPLHHEEDYQHLRCAPVIWLALLKASLSHTPMCDTSAICKLRVVFHNEQHAYFTRRARWGARTQHCRRPIAAPGPNHISIIKPHSCSKWQPPPEVRAKLRDPAQASSSDHKGACTSANWSDAGAVRRPPINFAARIGAHQCKSVKCVFKFCEVSHHTARLMLYCTLRHGRCTMRCKHGVQYRDAET